MKRGLFYGWVCVAGAFLVQFLYGVQYSFGLFLGPLVKEFGCSRVALSLTPALVYGVAIPARPIWGKLVDARGGRFAFCASCLLGGAGLAISGLASRLWHLHLGYGLLWGAGWSAFFFTSSALVRRWFVSKAGLALGLAGAGAPFGWAVVLPLTEWVLESMGWRAGFFSLAALTWVVGCVGAAMVRNSPEELGLAPDGDCPGRSVTRGALASAAEDWDLGRAVRTSGFWMMAGVSLCQLTALSITTVHGVEHCVAQGVARATAAYVFGMMGLLSLSGKLGGGGLGDSLVRRGVPAVTARGRVLGLSGLLMGLGVLLLIGLPVAQWLWVWALVFGAGYGIHGPQYAAITGDMFGRKNIGLVMTVMTGVPGSMGGLIGPVLAGWIYDLTGRYDLGLWTAAILSLCSVVFAAMIRAPRKSRPTADLL